MFADSLKYFLFYKFQYFFLETFSHHDALSGMDVIAIGYISNQLQIRQLCVK